jgi:polysaccharide chain length determinant protein (PEP-CTERM system associated)
MELNTPQDYVEMAVRRKWWIIIPFVLVMMGSYGVYKRLPKNYEAQTLILVRPQQISKDYVQPTVSQSVSNLLATIKEQILSRSNLEKVITQLNLTKDLSDPLEMEKKAGSMRKAIKIEVQRTRRATSSSLSISFVDENPGDAARIVNKIASLFITENVNMREKQIRGASQFLEKELQVIQKRLKEKEEAIRKFKEEYMGELPSQLEANLAILERLQQNVQTNNQSFIAAQQRKANLENLINRMKAAKTLIVTNKGTAPKVDPLKVQVDDQRKHLQNLRTQYTDGHPDVIMAKATLAKLEAQLRERKSIFASSKSKETNLTVDPDLMRLNGELQEVIVQIDRLTNEQTDIKRQIALYQKRVQSAPKREEQMSKLWRDYNLLQENYRSLRDKKIQAQLAENLEEKRKGEQFKILDSATTPMYPVKPDKNMFFGVAFVIGLGLGGGLAFLREHSDQSFYKVDDVETFLGFPVIATLPKIETRRSKES